MFGSIESVEIVILIHSSWFYIKREPIRTHISSLVPTLEN